MIVMSIAWLAAQPAPMPLPAGPPVHATTPEAEELGVYIALNGMLSGLLPLAAQRDIREILAANPSLTAAEQAQLRATGARVIAAELGRLMTATGHAYAQRMSLAELRRVAAFYRTSAARALREATPAAMVETMQAVAGIDLKREVLVAFCHDTGKLCQDRR